VPWSKPPARPHSSGRKPGGQPGHPGHHRELLPPEQVTKVNRYVPPACANCGAPLRQEASPDDPEPRRHQVVEIPAPKPEVTEERGEGRRCEKCGHITYAEIPAPIRAHTSGPNLAAIVSYFTGRCHLGKRLVQEALQDVWGVVLSLGSIAKLEQEMSAALEPAYAEAEAEVQAAPVKNVDETGWFKQGKLCWLWLAATLRVAFFKIHAQRGQAGLCALLGATVRGIVGSDRWGAYAKLLLSAHQLCWAHLKRDFQKLLDWGGEAAVLGRAGAEAVEEVFAAWQDFKGGRLSRAELRARLEPVLARLYEALTRARDGPDKKTARFSRRLLKVYPALWTFLSAEGVEPTNNHGERMLRSAVLWRKCCFGNHSEAGCRFAERILTVVQTLRLRRRSVLHYLRWALVAFRAGLPTPALLTA
jgi:transposase